MQPRRGTRSSSGPVPRHTALQVRTRQLRRAVAAVPDPDAVLGLAVPTRAESLPLHGFPGLFVLRLFVTGTESQLSTSSSGNKSSYISLCNVCGETALRILRGLRVRVSTTRVCLFRFSASC